MKKPISTRIAGLDTLRALAILAVMAFHLSWRLPERLMPVARFGWMGVDLFFVLSGYLIGSQLLRPVSRRQEISLIEFYRKRAYRILPAYLVVLGLYLLWPAWHEDKAMSPLWQFLTFTENLFVDYSKNHAFSHVWSLCVEEHFYLVLPLLVLWLSRRPALWKTVSVLLFFVVLGVAMRSYELVHVLRPLDTNGDEFSTRYIERIYYPTYSRLDGLLAGVALALIRIFRPAWWSAIARRANWLLLAGCALVGGCVYLFFNRFSSDTGPAAVGIVIGYPLLSLGLAFLVVAAIETRSWLGRVRVPGAKLLATLAFSLYLTHKEIARLDSLYWHHLAQARDWRSVLLLGVTCVAGAAILYLCVERPFLALRDHREKRVPVSSVDEEARLEPAL
ncbi:acyltransferase family protein [Granulicella mallensis]|uniref:Acyltransferase 3 n=1 Tax=Granulicella mallensis (strain ATCC BAA-1857 / DSM 23137 / MP5ACTX8) TaxID=682795 RepID=G8NWJ9_GRAMM|nr:acyltransferase [Granulicella mallensis]AEU38886.1 acyltransferase 3 [Granulicella mallensis MP5ACTX8]